MLESLESLSTTEQVYVVFAAVGTTIFLIRLVMMVFGLGGGDEGDAAGGGGDGTDVDGDGSADHHADSDLDFKLLSFQGVVVFGMMFGYCGLAAARSFHLPPLLSTPIGVVGGVFMVWVVARLFRAFGRLQSSGTIDLAGTLGKEGSVYLTIPEGESGQVQIEVQGRLRIMDAVSEDKNAIPTDARVLVVGLVSGNVLVVQRI